MNSRTWTGGPEADRALNNLINALSGCIDDAADLVDIGIEKQQDIRMA